jgi:hypothetical protein
MVTPRHQVVAVEVPVRPDVRGKVGQDRVVRLVRGVEGQALVQVRAGPPRVRPVRELLERAGRVKAVRVRGAQPERVRDLQSQVDLQRGRRVQVQQASIPIRERSHLHPPGHRVIQTPKDRMLELGVRRVQQGRVVLANRQQGPEPGERVRAQVRQDPGRQVSLQNPGQDRGAMTGSQAVHPLMSRG